MSGEITYDCELCGKSHTAPKDKALALLKLCKECGKQRYTDGKQQQRKTMPPQAEKPTGDR